MYGGFIPLSKEVRQPFLNWQHVAWRNRPYHWTFPLHPGISNTSRIPCFHLSGRLLPPFWCVTNPTTKDVIQLHSAVFPYLLQSVHTPRLPETVREIRNGTQIRVCAWTTKYTKSAQALYYDQWSSCFFHTNSTLILLLLSQIFIDPDVYFTWQVCVTSLPDLTRIIFSIARWHKIRINQFSLKNQKS